MLNIENIVAQIITKPIKELIKEVNPVKNIKDILFENAFNIFFLIFSSLSLSLMLVCGIVLTLVQLSYQYDQGYRFFVNGGILTGLVLIGLSITSILLIKMLTKNKNEITEQPHIEMQLEIHPLELALANLINDFISEQNHKRSSKREQGLEQNVPNSEQTH